MPAQATTSQPPRIAGRRLVQLGFPAHARPSPDASSSARHRQPLPGLARPPVYARPSLDVGSSICQAPPGLAQSPGPPWPSSDTGSSAKRRRLPPPTLAVNIGMFLTWMKKFCYVSFFLLEYWCISSMLDVRTRPYVLRCIYVYIQFHLVLRHILLIKCELLFITKGNRE
jgi:hypothetical protein